jgi:hypothetical protein
MMSRLRLPPAWALIGLLAALLVPSAALANAVPTPEFYIRFAGWPGGDPAIAGAQLQGCADADCASPDLLVHQGRCEGPPCLAGEAAYGAGLYPLPAGGRALAFGLDWSAGPERDWETYPILRVALALDDGTRAAGLFEPQGYRNYYVARLSGDRIELQPYEQFPESTALTTYVFLSLSVFLGLNLLTEPLGVALAAWARGLQGRRALLAASLPINLISFPIVWGVFPAFTPFAGAEDLALAWASLGFLAVAAAAVAGLTAVPRLGRRGTIVILAALAPLLCAILASAYGALAALPLPPFPGLTTSPLLNLALIEVVVVLFEGWLYHRVSRGGLALREGLLVALGANLVSLAAMGALYALGSGG